MPPSAPGDVAILQRRLRKLARREREVFDLVTFGHSNATIAARLNMALKTVQTHRARINRKLGVHSAAGVILFAFRAGVLRPEEEKKP